jgi:hypothetical protein
VSELERRYRRLLDLYPRDHREQHGEEMLGVLVTGAGDRKRPGARDTADLLWGALRLHVRRAFAVDPGEVLAIVSLLGPVAMLAGAATSLRELAWWARAQSLPPYGLVPDAPFWVVWSVVAVLAALGRRRSAAVGAWLGATGLALAAIDSVNRWQWQEGRAGWLVLGGLTAVALTVSPGPVSGRALAGRAPVAVMAGAVLLAVGLGVLGNGQSVAEAEVPLVLAIGAFAAAGFRTRNGRRAALALLVPVMTMLLAAVADETGLRLAGSVRLLVFFGLPVVVLLLVVGLGKAVRRHRDEPVT